MSDIALVIDPLAIGTSACGMDQCWQLRDSELRLEWW